MSNLINFGVSPYRTVLSLNRVNDLMARNMERLSSGLRVNRAADDPAGLAVAIQLGADDRSASQALRNTNDGLSLLATAEGAMGEIGTILDRMRELAVQSANGTLTASQRSTIDDEFEELSAEIDRISTSTEFNGISLTDGTPSSLNIQVGINGGASNQISVTLSDASASALGVGTSSVDLTTATGATAAITTIDNAIDTVAGQRSSIGASQNRLESASSYMSELQLATRSARSGIMDADMAFEAAEMSRLQVIQAAGIAALAQAQNINHGIIGLLKA
ncbi:MAG: flagellin [Myxococcota bacterium]|nr:flagellin [Myxococcota bacterium]